MKPKDWDDNAPIYYNKVGATKWKEVPKPVEPSFIPMAFVCKSLSAYKTTNPLYQFLCSVFSEDEVRCIFRHYLVGTGKKWGGCAVFWQIDINGNVRAGKLMGYDCKTGHRKKEPQRQVTWAHSELRIADFHLVQCLFGEHLLPKRSTATVGLVESKKTALIMTHFMPDLLWLATGGKDGCFNENAIQVLRGRTVVLIPDLGGWEKWQKKFQMLKSVCKRVIMSDCIEKIATDEQREKGLDVADFFLMKPTAHEILADMIRRNPAVGLLVSKLDLEVCDEGEETHDGVP